MTFYETLAEHNTRPVPAEAPDPFLGFNFVSIDRYFPKERRELGTDGACRSRAQRRHDSGLAAAREQDRRAAAGSELECIVLVGRPGLRGLRGKPHGLHEPRAPLLQHQRRNHEDLQPVSRWTLLPRRAAKCRVGGILRHDSLGAERAPSATACSPQYLGVCPAIPPPQVEFVSGASPASEAGGAHMVQVRLSSPGTTLAAPVMVDVVDAGTGSAASGTDYVAFGTQTVTFAAGSGDGDTQPVTLTVSDDLLAEGDETVDLQLQNVVGPGATIGGQTTHELTITDDEPVFVEFNFASNPAAEAGVRTRSRCCCRRFPAGRLQSR